MSRRITLTDFEIEQLVIAIKEVRNQGNGSYQVTRVGRHWYDQLIEKLKTEPSSQKVSSDSAKDSIPQEDK